jgi:DNA-binding response OmpR family regulator
VIWDEDETRDRDDEGRGPESTSDAAERGAGAGAASADRRPRRGRRILVVDDDLAILEALAVLLDGRYDVVTATDGREALRLIEDHSVDLVVSDVLMPLVAGEELVEAARRAGVRIPVILISGHQERLERAREAGADAYLYKPFPFRLLEERIEGLLESNSS